MDMDIIISKMSNDGRFSDLLNTLDIKDVCLTKCCRGNPTIIQDPKDIFTCNIPGTCISATLNNNLIVYMLYKADIITKRQFQIYHSC